MDKTARNKIIRNIIILFSPFLVMILINEYCRIKLPPSNITNQINTDTFHKEECTWDCHDYGCQHAKKIDNKYVKTVYRNIIGFNKGNKDGKDDEKSHVKYQKNSVIFLVILWPLLMYLLLIKCVNIQQKINSIKKNNK